MFMNIQNLVKNFKHVLKSMLKFLKEHFICTGTLKHFRHLSTFYTNPTNVWSDL